MTTKIPKTPQLFIFAISHYCEKARWAMDYLEVPYELRFIAPGLHFRLAKKFQLAATSLPLLVTEDEVVQGSAAIIDWAETQSTSGKTLTAGAQKQDSRAIEGRLDDIAGVHTRRYFYSEALVSYPETVKPIFLIGIPFIERLLLHVMWPKVSKLMIKRMDLGLAQREESRQVIQDELAWLESLLSDGRTYLAGESLSRADITAASLFTRLSGAPEHPLAEQMVMPPKMTLDQHAWHARPALAWIRDIYQKHR